VTAASSGFGLGPAILFCPADRPDRYAKAFERADAVILDLEDAVAPQHKAAAREALIAHPLDPTRAIVRVNGFDSEYFEDDLEALRQTSYTTVMLPKATSSAQTQALRGWEVIALCESAAGVLAAADIAATEHVVALFWGAEDLVSSLGGSSSRLADGTYRDVARQARASVLLAATANGIAAIDSVFMDIPNLVGLAAEAEDAVASGFAATACIHPSQVDTIRAAYTPTNTQLDWARGVLALAETSHGAFTYENQMIDEPVLRHARTLLARAKSH
jgi:citrate lyase subunit beta/citryl-CoA lyase